jgi:O-antigen ligase
MVIALAAILLALLLTVTRASQLAFMVSAFVAIVMSGSRKLLLAAAILAIPVILGGLLFLQQSRNVGLLDATDESTLYRLTMWKDGLRLSTADAHNLVFGIGMDSTKKHWQEWGMFRGGFMPFGHFHSTPMQMLVERGIPALLLWLAVLFFYGWTLLQAIRRIKHDPEFSKWPFGIMLGCLGGLVGFFVSGLVHYNLGDGEVALIFYLLMGVGIKTAELISGNDAPIADEQRAEVRMAA